MSSWYRPAWLAVIFALGPGVAAGQVLFSETFNDGLAPLRWFLTQEGDNGIPDIDASLAFNYGVLGIAPAPRGTGTLGARLDANITGAGGAQAINIYPNGQNFSGDFVLRFDVWSQVGGDPANSTEDMLAGIHATGTRTNWLSIGSGTDGLYYGVTGNGGTQGGFDYVRYMGDTTGDPSIVSLYDNTDSVPQAAFPNSSGTPQNQWITVDLEYINNVSTLRLNGVTFDQHLNSGSFTAGNIFLGHQDIIWTGQGNALTYNIFDNVSVTRAARWLTDGNGSWGSPGNWSVAPSSSAGAVVYLGDVITGTRLVDVPAGQTVGHLILDSPLSYFLTGPAALTLASTGGQAVIDVRRGTHAIYAPVNFAPATRIDVAAASLTLWSDPTAPAGASLQKSGVGTLQLNRVRVATLTLSNGLLRIADRVFANDPAGTSIVQSLSIAGMASTPAATLDLGNQAMIIDYTGSAPLSTLRQLLRIGTQSGKGLLTSGFSTFTRLGYIDNLDGGLSSFAGQPVDATSLLIGFTYTGDANLDGKVDLKDLVRLATHWQSSGFWSGGDFNYDGVVNSEDLGLLAINWQSGAMPSLPWMEGMGSNPSVPEPATLLLGTLLFLPLLLLRRRAVLG